MQQYPRWLKRSWSPDGTVRQVGELLQGLQLETVCQSAVCPNLLECWSMRQLTFMILGERCTRRCGFCAVPGGRPQPPDPGEPRRVAEAVRRLGLQHAVITSVARDDLRDEGAAHFVAVVRQVRACNPGITVEVLVPDFHARPELIRQVVTEASPEVFAHNLETVGRLAPLVRPQAGYGRSLQALRRAAALGTGCLVKSGLMLGLGETEPELRQAFDDLRGAGVTHLTLGQYLRPSAAHLPVMEYVSPDRFAAYEAMAYDAGFAWVKAGPFVRSSYHAVDALAGPSERAVSRRALAPAAPVLG
jgi:lipoic acid synthetase